ncbi:MAG: SIMPL domain-containing protein, partial [Anaerolineales bacterium]|nr:SIMPL domain-containing protein [Anaerolineales bacterium]
AAIKEARAKAVKDAQLQAQELADAAGIKLGAIQSISFYDNSPYPTYGGKGGGAAYEAAASVPIQPGQLSISVSVSMNYEIK